MTDQAVAPPPPISQPPTPSPYAQPVRPRAQGWKARLKPFVVRAVSMVWVAWFKWRLGERVQFGRNFETNGRLVIQGPGRVVLGDNIKAWCHAEKNVLITYTPDSRITVGSQTRLNGAGLMAYTTIAI